MMLLEKLFVSDLNPYSQKRKEAIKRQVKIYVLHQAGMTFEKIAKFVYRDYSTCQVSNTKVMDAIELGMPDYLESLKKAELEYLELKAKFDKSALNILLQKIIETHGIEQIEKTLNKIKKDLEN